MKKKILVTANILFFFYFHCSGQVASNGTSTEGGIDATAIGRETLSSGDASTAMGAGTQATGEFSLATGHWSIASGKNSTAIGLSSEASGDFSSSIGYGTIASGNRSSAYGFYGNATGNYSMTFSTGMQTTAKGINSISMGNATKAQSAYSIALGSNNIDNGDSTTWVETDPLLTIGNANPNQNTVTPSNALTILKNGTVLIGTTSTTLNPNAVENTKLAVNGVIYAAGMRVRLPVNGSFPDYVFDKSYKLKPLSEVEQYIKTNHHLEGIPSAKVAEAEGIDVAAMNIKLLEKVEELTLYLIQLKKENDLMKEKSKAMQDEINNLKKR